MKQPKVDRTLAQQNDGPPVGFVPLRQFVFTNDVIVNSLVYSLSGAWAYQASQDALKTIFGGNFESFDERPSLPAPIIEMTPLSIEIRLQAYHLEEHIKIDRLRGTFNFAYQYTKSRKSRYSPSEVLNGIAPDFAGSAAKTGMRLAFEKLGLLVQKGVILAWGRPGGVVRTEGWIIPRDAFPDKWDSFDLTNNSLRLADGTIVYSCHLSTATTSSIAQSRGERVFDGLQSLYDKMVSSPNRAFNNSELQNWMKEVGMNITNFKAEKRDARQKLAIHHPEIEQLYAKHDPSKSVVG